MKNSNKISERLSEHLRKMTRKELMNIKGGESAVAGCSAKCSDGGKVECEGSSCSAADGVGCAAGTGEDAMINLCSSVLETAG